MPHEAISVFDMFKIGVGPSSSHTLGPWKAALKCIDTIKQQIGINNVKAITVLLYGSLAKTGKGHGTDIAVMLGLCGANPETIDVNSINPTIQLIKDHNQLLLGGENNIVFNSAEHLKFLYNETLPFHPNGMSIIISTIDGKEITETYYSVGGGFVIKEGEENNSDSSVDLTFSHKYIKRLRTLVYENRNAYL
jgi:L-serine dehydratase